MKTADIIDKLKHKYYFNKNIPKSLINLIIDRIEGIHKFKCLTIYPSVENKKLIMFTIFFATSTRFKNMSLTDFIFNVLKRYYFNLMTKKEKAQYQKAYREFDSLFCSKETNNDLDAVLAKLEEKTK